jgi:regulator of replication initiation timing
MELPDQLTILQLDRQMDAIREQYGRDMQRIAAVEVENAHLRHILDQQHEFIAVLNRKITDLEETCAKHKHHNETSWTGSPELSK